MEQKTMKYEAAMQELEQIVSRLEQEDVDVDALTKELKRAKELIALCKDRLTKTDEEIKSILTAEEK